MAKYGLIGKNIGYSFSKHFFTAKFENEKRQDTYQNFDLQDINEFPKLISENCALRGLNVTVPYKESIIPFLDKIDIEAKAIGAVNTIKFMKSGKLNGYNTDYYGFAKVLTEIPPLKERTALILGTGGASKAITYVLDTLGFKIIFVSRTKKEGTITYNELTQEIISSHYLIINCTPLGTFPRIEEFPNIPYQYLTNEHFLFDLTYNPQVTSFMKFGKIKGANTCNGMKMLEYQAEKALTIWKR
ncbi:MAG: shikimate dehydrogenase [Flavobacteriaceae bacterium]|jgi:shikimate dehydrogenase|uniref:shikimate dehydrogenase family protein n=1 Tax=Candidatus Marifrigoribacter sp. Uisw_064 TaxID=3230970 RepID=UPI003AED5C8B